MTLQKWLTNNMFHPAKYGFLIFLLMIGFFSYGQITPQPKPSADTIKEFEIIRGPSMRGLKIDSVTTLQTIAGGAIVKQGNTLFNSDSAVINPTAHTLEAFGNVVINQGDTVHIYCQYLKYLGIEKMAYFKNKVRLTNKSGTLYTDTLNYNLQTGIGNYFKGGKVIQGKSIITSIEGTYYDDTKDIYFKKDVKLDEPQKHIRADSLLYNMQTHQSTFISKTNIKTPEVEINTTQGNYDLNSGNAFFTSRTTVKDSSNRLYSANNMALENKTGNAQLEGNAVIIDSAGGYTIIANQIFMNKKNNSFLATRKPVLILKGKSDSTFIAADTIFSGFTNFVNNKNRVLRKDSVINFNEKENKKVEETILNDTTQNIGEILQNEIADSAARRAHLKDTAKISERNKFSKPGKEIIKPPAKNTLLKEIYPKLPKKDSSTIKDSSQKNLILRENKIDSLPKKDSLEKEMIPNQLMDSSAIDSSSKSLNSKITDSLQSEMKPGKDSVNKADTSIRYFLAFHHVKIYNDSLQSVCDSMFISSKDSTFRLYYDPVVWSGNTQISGDTIFLYTKEKQPARLYVFESGLIVNKTKEGFFNQMSGKTINGYFINGKIDYMRVKGSQSESIYYMQNDDSAYIGMNRATGDVIDLYFKNENLNKVIFINQIQGKMYPMSQIPEDQKKLRTFEWLDSRRPKTKAELFE
ncbi:MAG: OstA-like protein [Ginsengibacter sp.]